MRNGKMGVGCIDNKHRFRTPESIHPNKQKTNAMDLAYFEKKGFIVLYTK